MTVGTKIGVAFAVGLVVLAAVGGSAYVSTQRLLEANRWVVHTHEVQEKLEDVLAAHLDAETGQRGFIITGEERYLEPYNAGIIRIQQDIDALAGLTSDNASQQETLQQVRKLSEGKLAELRETIRLRKESGLERVLPVIRDNRGKKIMDDLRRVVAQMKAREQTLLDKRTAVAEASASRTIWTIAVWLPLALVVLAVAGSVLTRTVRFGGASELPSTAGRAWAGIALRYASAVIIVTVATVLRWRLEESFGPLPVFITFYPAILLVLTIGGGGPGILATVLTSLAATYWFIPPIGSFHIDAPNHVLALGIFIGCNLCLCILAERFRRARWAEALSVAQQERAEELSRQSEEVSQQSEELARQNEELQAQSEEVQVLNDELGRREEMLQSLLEASRLAGSEQAAMQEVCAAALRMFGEAAAAVIVCEKEADRLMIRAIAGAGQLDAAPESLPAEHSFPALVIWQNRTSSLSDVSLRPDLSNLHVPGLGPFRAVLCAPLQRAGQAFGAVAIYSGKRQEWTAEQFRLAEWLAGECTQTLEALRTRDELRRQAALIDLSPDGIMVLRMDGTITLWGHGAEVLYGWTKDEAIGQNVHLLLRKQFPEPLEQIEHQLRQTGQWSGELVHVTKDGRQVVVQSRWLAQRDTRGEFVEILESNVDITERKQAESEREATVEFLRLANESRTTRSLVEAAAGFLQRHSGCEAVGIRLRDGDDYPYWEARGFPQQFLRLENSLCTRDLTGQIVRDAVGNPVMECMCGNVIQGRFDASKPFFTAHGSFWTNCTTELLASTTEADRQSQTRNRCNGQGYESVALVPLTAGAERMGLLQFNDRKKGKFSPAIIAFWERVAGYFAAALAKLRAEEAVRESEERFHTTANAIPQLAWIAKADGYIHWYNRRWYDYTGTTPEQMEGWGWQSVHDPEALPKVVEQWKASLATGEPFDMIFPLRGADGVFRPFLTRVMPLKDGQGRVQQWFGTNTDVSDQKRAEEELLAARDSAEKAKASAELANRAKDHFLAVLSHELRTPLTPVVMGVSMLQDKPDLDPDMRGTLEMVRRNVEMEARLIDDLLDVMRIARGKIELARSVVELCTVINRAVDVCKADIEARGLHFGVDLGPAAPYWIEADVSRLQQVFWNLLKNSIKFTPHGGCVDVRCRTEPGHVVAEVNDSGIGIAAEALPRIFNAFEQAERSITRQFGGLGLGLTICKALVEMHAGTIEVHSEGLGKGATFRVRLPLTAPAAQSRSPAPAAPRARPARSLRILLVEDHGATAHLLRLVLSYDGHEVESAGDVATALELAEKQAFDLLISDLGLPDGSGHDLMRRLRQRGHKLPGIALSGYGQEEDIQRSREAGFAAHLTKPASRQVLLEAVTSVVAGQSTTHYSPSEE